MVYIFLAEGFEEVEAVTIVDYLRRGEVAVKTVSISENTEVTGAHGISIKADITMTQADFEACEMIVLPGGLPGTDYLEADETLRKHIKCFASHGKKVAAICAAPTVLAKAGVLEGKRATSYPTRKDTLGNVAYSDDKVVTDGNVTTSRGPGTAVDFALELLRIMKDEKTMKEIKEDILL